MQPTWSNPSNSRDWLWSRSVNDDVAHSSTQVRVQNIILQLHDIQFVSYLKVKVKEFDYSTFMQYLTSIAGGRKNKSSATAIVAEIKNYYNFIGDFSETGQHYYDYLLNLQHLKAYLDYLQEDCELAPTTISEKIRRLRLAIEFTLFFENPAETDAVLFTRAHQILMHLSKWGKSLSKGIKEQRRKHSLVSAKQVTNYCNVIRNMSHFFITYIG